MYCLWISGKQVYNLKQLKENFDLDSVEIYYSGGGLVRWLRLCGEDETADKVEKIDTSSDLSERLAEIFGQPKPEKKALPNTAFPDYVLKPSGRFDSSFSEKNMQTDVGSLESDKIPDSFTCESLLPSSHGITSSNVFSQVYVGSSEVLSSSFSLKSSSFSLYGAFFSTTSFNLAFSSFGSSSFHEFEYEFESGGSFKVAGGSFSFGSFGICKGGFTDTSFVNSSFKIKKISSCTSVSEEKKDGGFDCGIENAETETPKLSPNEKVLQNIIACPLNRFGYGLHLI